MDFTKRLWIQDITNEEFGNRLEKVWNEKLDIENTFVKLKSEYDVTYKKHNVEELNKNNIVTLVIVAVILVINLIAIWIAQK